MNLKGNYYNTIIFPKSWVKTFTKSGFILLPLFIILTAANCSFGSKTCCKSDTKEELQFSDIHYKNSFFHISSPENGLNSFILFSETENCNENNSEEDFADNQVTDDAYFASFILFQDSSIEDSLKSTNWMPIAGTQSHRTVPYFILFHSWKSYLI